MEPTEQDAISSDTVDLGNLLPEVVDLGKPKKQGLWPEEYTKFGRAMAARHKTARSIRRKTNKCPVCKYPDIDRLDQMFLWGVDAITLFMEYNDEHPEHPLEKLELDNHLWRHQLYRRRFMHPAQLYQSFFNRINFRNTDPNTIAALAFKSVEKLIELKKDKDNGYVNPEDSPDFSQSADAELKKLLSMKVPEEPEWDPSQTGIASRASEEPQEDRDSEGDFEEDPSESEGVDDVS